MRAPMMSHTAITASPALTVILAAKRMDHLGRTGCLPRLPLLPKVDHSDRGSSSQKTAAGGNVQTAAWKQVPTVGLAASQLEEEFQKESPWPHSHSP